MAATKEGGKGLNTKAMEASMVLLRLFLGVKFLVAGYQKWDWIGTPSLAKAVHEWAAMCPFGFYKGFLLHTVVPHGTLFTYLVVFGELGVGICLLLGLLTRLSALIAMMLSLNFLLTTWHLGRATQGVNESFVLMSFALLITGAGRLAGIDQILAKSRPRWILW